MKTSQPGISTRIGVNVYETEHDPHAGSCLLSLPHHAERLSDAAFFFVTGEAGCRLLSKSDPAGEGATRSAAEGFGWMGKPALRIAATFPKPVYLSVLLQDLAQLAAEAGLDPERPLGIRLKAECAQLEYEESPGGGYHEQEEVSLDEAAGFLFLKPEHIPRDDDNIRALSRYLATQPAGGGVYALLLSTLRGLSSDRLTGDTAIIQPETLLRRADISLFAPHRSCDAADFLLK
ncbi:hypothetical protein CYPRO_1506 [Cyclonatronum proteinivorum]|uniref:Uncharacterized protein n=1 Tax=Cyclonatronum proteinivorum TaxID=1457365 RepID=A0A345UJW0_9BACT|nr:hypothetical protein [Cyclonatronum proteinivorum]AXJ00762.1 hypothetical protein CYPRO_1506 [Cyclonatronum proteinivorum]